MAATNKTLPVAAVLGATLLVWYAGCIGLNARELFACGLDPALVVGRPPTLKRSDVARQVFVTRTHELHA